MLDFKICNHVVSVSWVYPCDKWFGFDHYTFYTAVGFGFFTICIYLDD